MAAVNAATLPSGETVADAVGTLAAKIGEKLEISQAAYFDGQTAVYLHRRASDLPPQVGALVEYEGADADAARTAAMQIAAMRRSTSAGTRCRPTWSTTSAGSPRRPAKAENKPAQAVPRIVEGRVNAYFKDVALLDQPSVTDNKTPVGKLLDAAGVKVNRFVRFEAASS